MPREPSVLRRLGTATRWPVGIVWTSWRYLWRTTPIHRRELDGSWPEDGPPPIREPVSRDEIQRPEDGAGPLFRRRYRARIGGPGCSAAALMAALQADPNLVVPGGIAHFQKVTGRESDLRVGDEFVVRMPGPWDGPIRVVEVTSESFRFATLAGHLEAGQIQWRARDEHAELIFEIESWARGGDRASHVLHDHLRMAKEVQLHMWTTVLERVTRHVGGRLVGGIDVQTRRAELP